MAKNPEHWRSVIAQQPAEHREPANRPSTPEPPAAMGGKSRTLVISRYSEDLSWTHPISRRVPTVIYNHGESLDHSPHVTQIQTRNVGREAHGIIKFCHDSFDDLPELVFFTQGSPDHCPDLWAKLAVDWDEPTSLAPFYMEHHPPQHVKDEDHVYESHGVQIRLGKADVFGQFSADRQTNAWLDRIWSEVFTCERPHPLLFGYAATWAVPREAIRRRGREFWAWALSVIEGPAGESLRDRNDEHPLTAWAWEALWHYVWQDPAVYPHKVRWTVEKPRKKTVTVSVAEARAMGAIPPSKIQPRKGCGCGEKRAARRAR